MKRIHLLAILVAVVVVASTSTALAYILTRPLNLAVSDGSTSGTIEGNLTTVSSWNPLVRNFTATTYANQTGHPSSTLVMQIQTATYFVGPSPGYLELLLTVNALGHFASDLHPSGLSLMGNQTGTALDSLGFQSGQQAGTNVSFNPNQMVGGWGNGSWAAERVAFVNEAGAGTYYDFSYTAVYILSVYMGSDYLGSAHFDGFRVTVDGSFTPSVGVGVLLQIINT